jgi:hypothetical protein
MKILQILSSNRGDLFTGLTQGTMDESVAFTRSSHCGEGTRTFISAGLPALNVLSRGRVETPTNSLTLFRARVDQRYLTLLQRDYYTAIGISPNNSVGVVTRNQTRPPRNPCSSPRKCKRFSSPQNQERINAEILSTGDCLP